MYAYCGVGGLIVTYLSPERIPFTGDSDSEMALKEAPSSTLFVARMGAPTDAPILRDRYYDVRRTADHVGTSDDLCELPVFVRDTLATRMIVAMEKIATLDACLSVHSFDDVLAHRSAADTETDRAEADTEKNGTAHAENCFDITG